MNGQLSVGETNLQVTAPRNSTPQQYAMSGMTQYNQLGQYQATLLQTQASLLTGQNGIHQVPLNTSTTGTTQLISPDQFLLASMARQMAAKQQDLPSGGGINGQLLNMDIPSSNFMKAVNFDLVATTAGHNGQASEQADFDEEDMISECYINEYEEVDQLGVNSDLFEQQQAREQARLFDRYKQLREWQLSQQAALMQQQKEQLNLLRTEQQRVQAIIAKQRQAQWGAGDQGALTTLPPKSPRKEPNAARKTGDNSAESPNRKRREQVDSLPSGRPVPLIPSVPSTPSEYVEHGNPNLDSDTNTIDSLSICTDGVAPLAETACECDQAHPTANAKHSGQARKDDSLCKQLFINGDISTESSPDRPVIGNKCQILRSNISDVKVHMKQNQVLDFREEIPSSLSNADKQQSTSEYLVQKSSSGVGQADEMIPPKSEYSPNQGDANDFDEIPVTGLGARKKTFEELLEEELRKEQLKTADSPVEECAKAPKRKPFLRKGSGLAYTRTKCKPTRKSSSAANVPKPSTVFTAKSKSTTGNFSTVETRTRPEAAQKKAAPAISEQMPPPAVVPAKPGGATCKPQHGVTDSVGEISFQQRMQELEQCKKDELHELEEFELLEQFADDNASFLSNASAVNRVLSRRERPNTAPSTVPQPQLPNLATRVQTQLEDDVTLSSESEHSDQESSDTEVNSDVESDQEDSIDNYDVTDGIPAIKRLTKEPFLGGGEASIEPQKASDANLQSLRRIRQHVVSLVQKSKPPVTTQNERVEQSRLPTDDLDFMTSQSIQNDNQEKSGDHGMHVRFDKLERHHTVQNDYHRLSQKIDTESKNLSSVSSQAIIIQNSPPNPEPEESGSDESETDITKPETDDDELDEQSDSEDAGKDGVEFEDEDEWAESSEDAEKEPPSNKASNISIPVRKTAIVKTKVLPEHVPTTSDLNDDVMRESTAPPTSQLVSKLFPKLKDDKVKENAQKQQEQQVASTKQVAVADGVQSKALRDKLQELEREIERFRNENGSLAKLRKEREEGLSHLKKEMDEFQKQKREELNRLQEFKNEEMKKLRKEKKVFQQYQKAAKAMPDKKEREEIDSLKTELSELRDEMKRKEQRWTSSTTRLRSRVEELEQENEELKQQVQLLEQRRLQAWQKREVSAATSTHDKHMELAGHQSKATRTAKQLRPEAPSIAPPGDNENPLRNSANSDQPRRLAHLGSSPEDITVPSTRTAPPMSALGEKNSRSPRYMGRRDNPTQLTDDVRHVNLRDSANTINVRDSAVNVRDKPATLRDTGGTLNGLDSGATINIRDSGGSVNVRHSGDTVNVRDGGEDVRDSLEGAREGKSVRRKTAVAVSGISHTVDKGDEKYDEIQHPDGKVERTYSNGAREILYSNGTRRQISADGQSIIISFYNGDMKQILPDQRVVYYYAETRTTHTTYPDGLQVLQFPNNQIEKHYPDGTKEITLADQSIKYLFPSGMEENILPDGTVIRSDTDGTQTVEFPNGQREIHTQQYKKREYPDGTVKTVYLDGRQETRYSSGRIRVKDKQGVIIYDTRG